MQRAALRGRLDGFTRRSISSLTGQFNGSRLSVSFTVTTRRSFHFSRRQPSTQFLRLRHSVGRPSLTSVICVRHKSAVSGKGQKHPILRALYNIFAYCGFFIVSSGVVVLAFFVYDASTYREDPSTEDIPVSELALNPRRGGPKNLPIAEILVDDEDSDDMEAQRDKPKLVILGTGWGATALLKTINPGDYHVTVVSPVNYFLFTPMLPSATVGTLGLRSLVEPARRIVHRVRGHFLKAKAEDVDFSSKLVEVSQIDANGQKQHFYLPYDKLVIAVGMLSSRF